MQVSSKYTTLKCLTVHNLVLMLSLHFVWNTRGHFYKFFFSRGIIVAAESLDRWLNGQHKSYWTHDNWRLLIVTVRATDFRGFKEVVLSFFWSSSLKNKYIKGINNIYFSSLLILKRNYRVYWHFTIF